MILAAANFLETIHNNTKIATDALTLAKATQEHHANKSWRDVSFQVGDRILLSSNHIHLASQATCPSKKLQPRFLGPYTITHIVSPVAYKLELPDTLRVHPVFHVSVLRPYMSPTSYPDRPAPVPPPLPVSVDDHVEYEVERILDACCCRN